MIAVLRLDGPLDLSDCHTKEGIRERRDKAAALRPAQIPAVLCRARVLRVLLGEFAEILPRLRLREHLLRLRERCGVVLARDQDVARVALLGYEEAGSSPCRRRRADPHP